MSRTELIAAFLKNTTVRHLDGTWTIEGLQREDGSGFCFILELQNTKTGERKTTFIRTHDEQTLGRPENTLFKNSQGDRIRNFG